MSCFPSLKLEECPSHELLRTVSITFSERPSPCTSRGLYCDKPSCASFTFCWGPPARIRKTDSFSAELTLVDVLGEPLGAPTPLALDSVNERLIRLDVEGRLPFPPVMREPSQRMVRRQVRTREVLSAAQLAKKVKSSRAAHSRGLPSLQGPSSTGGTSSSKASIRESTASRWKARRSSAPACRTCCILLRLLCAGPARQRRGHRYRGAWAVDRRLGGSACSFCRGARRAHAVGRKARLGWPVGVPWSSLHWPVSPTGCTWSRANLRTSHPRPLHRPRHRTGWATPKADVFVAGCAGQVSPQAPV